MAAQAEVKSMGAEACGSVVPLLASRSASVLPPRPTCPGIHWTLTRFDEPIFARTVQMELHVVSVCRAGPWARRWISDLESVRILIPCQAS